MLRTILISLAFLNYIINHSTKYRVDRNETCFNPEPAKIYSWHIHLLYWQTNSNHTRGAYEIRNKFIEAFNDTLGEPCTDLFHQEQLCMFEPDVEPVGPFLTAQWSIFVPNEDFHKTVPWIMQHRGNYDVLVHPNSGCELEDHSDWAFWGGQPWHINMEAFSYDYPFPWPEDKNSEKEPSQLVKAFLEEHPSF